jgi:hypothetical protein
MSDLHSGASWPPDPGRLADLFSALESRFREAQDLSAQAKSLYESKARSQAGDGRSELWGAWTKLDAALRAAQSAYSQALREFNDEVRRLSADGHRTRARPPRS